LKPGDRIIEAKIAKEMHVSSIPIREAIRELETMRILESVPHKGARVRKVSLLETIEALQVKAVLEGLAARLATPLPAGHREKMILEAKKCKADLQKQNYIAFQEHNQKFHGTLVEASGNSILLRSWHALAFDVRTRLLMDFLGSVDQSKFTEEHENIIDALEAGEGEKAASLLVSHANGLVSYLKQKLAEGYKEFDYGESEPN
jgi:DNA-binding GntR family transcriptional regulator